MNDSKHSPRCALYHEILQIKARYQVLMAVCIEATVLWEFAPCSLVEVNRRFTGVSCLHHQGDRLISVSLFLTFSYICYVLCFPCLAICSYLALGLSLWLCVACSKMFYILLWILGKMYKQTE
jgi:hypothetical protein